MKRRIYIWSSVLVVVLAVWIGGKAMQAGKNLVTLNVRDADVRDVLRKCEWQTWETIVVHKNVKGKVTLNVVKVPLEEVLGIISEQTSTSISAVYPIYSKRSSYVNLRKLARGDIHRDTAGWTNFTMVGGGGRGGGPGGFGGRGGGGPGGGFGGIGGDTMLSQHTPITLSIAAKDLNFATLALARRANSQVVPEDGADGLITVNLQEVPLAKAVAQVAKAAHRKSEVFYSVQAQPDFFADRGDFMDFGRRGDGESGFGRRGTNGGRFNRDGETNWQARLEARQDEREMARQREMEARLATMTPEEQKKEQERQQQFEEMRNLPPEQRQQAFEQMRNNPQMAQRFENRRISYLNNSTSEQRLERQSRNLERRVRRNQQQQQPRR